MALKGNRNVIETDISMTCDVATERGVVLVSNTSAIGSGVALGDSRTSATLVLNPSGRAVTGMLMNDVVTLDQTRYQRNWHKDEMVVGEPVNQLRKGQVTTNKVTGTPTYGSTAYLTTSGVLTPTVSSTGGTVATPKVGMFAGKLDADGYAKVDINLPIV